MTQWLKTLAGCLCVLTVLMHLIPKGKFSGYVRFYGGLLFFLVAAGPIWKLMAGEGELERLLQLEFLRNDYYDLESSVTGMAELKNDQIREAYRGEIVRQICEIASAYGIKAEDVQVTFGEDGYRMTGVSLCAGMASAAAFATPERAGDSQGMGVGDDPAEDQIDFASAAESLRRELAGVYALDLSQIRIRTGESGKWENGWTK